MCLCMCTDMHIYMCMRICACTYRNVASEIHKCAYTCILQQHAGLLVHLYMCTHYVSMHTSTFCTTYQHIHTHINICIPISTYAYKQHAPNVMSWDRDGFKSGVCLMKVCMCVCRVLYIRIYMFCPGTTKTRIHVVHTFETCRHAYRVKMVPNVCVFSLVRTCTEKDLYAYCAQILEDALHVKASISYTHTCMFMK